MARFPESRRRLDEPSLSLSHGLRDWGLQHDDASPSAGPPFGAERREPSAERMHARLADLAEQADAVAAGQHHRRPYPYVQRLGPPGGALPRVRGPAIVLR